MPSIIITIESTGIAKKYYDVSNMICSDENAILDRWLIVQTIAVLPSQEKYVFESGLQAALF